MNTKENRKPGQVQRSLLCPGPITMGISEKVIYTRATLRINMKRSKGGTVSVLPSGNANLNSDKIIVFLEARLAHIKIRPTRSFKLVR